MRTRWRDLDRQDGVTAIEYALISSIVALSIVGAAALLGGSLSGIFTWFAEVLTDATP